MKKIIALVLVLILCLLLCSCSNDSSSNIETASATLPPNSADADVSFLIGTWRASGVIVNGVNLTLGELQALGQGDGFESYYVIIKEGGKGYISVNGNFFDWTFSSGTLVMDGLTCSFVDENIGIPAKDFILLLEKVSNNQEIDSIPNAEPIADASEIPPTESIEDHSSTEASQELRPEFKEAMDAYEAFYDEYCSFMEEYMKNPTDMNLLLKYSEMLTKLNEMDAAFNSWDQDEMTNEELKYYLDVNNRVMQKLLDIAN